MTQGEFVSTIIKDLKLDTKDTWVPRRHILNVGKSKAKMLLSQRVDDYKVRNSFDLVSTINCFEMEEVDRISCDFIDVKNCNTLYKSVKKIPETVYGRSTLAIFSVTTIDDSISFTLTSPETINNRKKLKYKKPGNDFFYFIIDGYLYVTEEVEALKIRMIALNEEEVEECDCSKTDEEKERECRSAWDIKFPASDLLFESVRAQTLQELMATIAQIPKDENPNMDSNQKSATVK